MAPTPEHLAVIPHDFWYVYPEHAEDIVEVTCLLPNGIGISFSVSQQATMYEIKEVGINLLNVFPIPITTYINLPPFPGILEACRKVATIHRTPGQVHVRI